MDDVARMSAQDRADLFSATAAKRAFNVVVVEKDFWVCWTLKRLFTLTNPPAGLIFKGGTSLSKVFGAIERFSEDVDLSFDRADLGFGGEHDPAHAPSKKKKNQWIDDLKTACQIMIRDKLLPQLNQSFAAALGTAPGDGWQLEIDPHEEDGQTVLFRYPPSRAIDAAGPGYVQPLVRLEMGARGEHWPMIDGEVRPYAAEDFPAVFKQPVCTVKVVSAERTFWEKATILHMRFHAGIEQALGDRQSRHYYDVVQLYERGIGKSALLDPELLRAVARHKSVFFGRAWAKFEEAVPGTLRLDPPEARLEELERDYQKMREEMIFGDAPPLSHIIEVLREIERQVNGG